MTALDRFLNKEKSHSQVIWMFTTFGEYWLLSEKQMLFHCSFMDTFWRKNFPIPGDAKKWPHYLGETQCNHHRLESWNLCFLQPPYLQRYADVVAGKGATLYNCFDFVDGVIARICRPLLSKRVVYSHHTKVHGGKCQSVVLPNGFIINFHRSFGRSTTFDSGLLNQFHWLAWFNNQSLFLYGDHA